MAAKINLLVLCVSFVLLVNGIHSIPRQDSNTGLNTIDTGLIKSIANELGDYIVFQVLGALLGAACSINGGINGYFSGHTAALNLRSCARDIAAKHPEPIMVGSSRELAKKNCEELEQYKGCVSAYLTGVSSCFKTGGEMFADKFENFTNSMIDFMCVNDGENLMRFAEAKGVECLIKKLPELVLCVSTFMKELMELDQNAYYDHSVRTQKVCKISLKVRECVMPEFATCHSRIADSIVEKYFDTLDNLLTCK